jgi:hypothetical protein
MQTRVYRKIGILLLIILVVMQVVQPNKNASEQIITENDISKVYVIPDGLHQTLIKKCYDCHSNNTRYPWYAYVQPIGWWLAAHVHDGKEHLNFSEFKNYDQKKAAHQLEELQEVVEERSMPLKLYTMFHKEAELTVEDEKAITDWLASLNTASL